MQRLRFEMRSSFPLGEMVITQGAMSELTQADVLKAFVRHTRGDWGDLCDEDKQEKVTFAIKKIDQAAAKGLIHKNNAANKKSALAIKAKNA